MLIDMKLPELGENIEGGDVLRVIVKPGDAIKKDQPVLEVETDKASIEIPSSADGVVKEAKVKAGEKIKVGQTIFVVESGAAAPASVTTPSVQTPAPKPAPSPSPAPDTPRAPASQAPESAASQKRPAQVVEMTRPKPAVPDSASIPAAPAARRLARELGVNIQDIQGSGPAGRISMDDVTAFARRLLQGGGGGRAAAAGPLPAFSAWGAVERKPMSAVRRTTAHRLTQPLTTVPYLLQHDRPV